MRHSGRYTGSVERSIAWGGSAAHRNCRWRFSNGTCCRLTFAKPSAVVRESPFPGRAPLNSVRFDWGADCYSALARTLPQSPSTLSTGLSARPGGGIRRQPPRPVDVTVTAMSRSVISYERRLETLANQSFSATRHSTASVKFRLPLFV